MADLAQRFPGNPVLAPDAIRPSVSGFEVTCVLNPGVFRHEGRIWLAARVAERPPPIDGLLRVPVIEHDSLRILEFDTRDPEIDLSDPRIIRHCGRTFLTTLSHLRLFHSDDGIAFIDAGLPPLTGNGPGEAFGIEDCRVSTLPDGRYLAAYTAVSGEGHGVGLRETRDWRTFTSHGMILPPPNKDCAVFEETIGGRYLCLHRPSAVMLGGHAIWLAESADLTHWGHHRFVAGPRPGCWDSARIGAGAAPIRTPHGWLAIYHGADHNQRYCLGAMLLDTREPWKVTGRSATPIMEPAGPLEEEGFFGQVVFTNGHVVDDDTLTIYYGAADTWICGAQFDLTEIIATLK